MKRAVTSRTIKNGFWRADPQSATSCDVQADRRSLEARFGADLSPSCAIKLNEATLCCRPDRSLLIPRDAQYRVVRESISGSVVAGGSVPNSADARYGGSDPQISVGTRQ
jgi:hypothetical protein